MGTARGTISYNRKDDLCDCSARFVFVFLDVNVLVLLWRWYVKAEVTKQTFFGDRRTIAGVSWNVYLLRVTLCLLRCSMPIIYLKDLLKWLWAFGPRASQKTTTTAKKKKKKHVSRAKQREHTHGFLEETQDKKSGGDIFVAVVLCHRFLLFVGKIETQRIFEVRMWCSTALYRLLERVTERRERLKSSVKSERGYILCDNNEL